MGFAGVGKLALYSSSSIATVGTKFGKMGTLVKNPNIQITKFTNHALKRMNERNITEEMVKLWMKTGKTLEQAGDKLAYVSKKGVAIVTKTGEVITAYGKEFFDDTMNKIIEQLFGK